LEKGLIYKDAYEGWYSVADECFYRRGEIEERDSVLGSFMSDQEPLRV
jgi:methionyl-tRNA synthetase